jgi:succinate dehydrogenase/fumarate reductase cytochrome b subunit
MLWITQPQYSRLLSVILGIYGIIVVSLVTSIIVNFYSEVKTDEEAMEEFAEAEAVGEKDETGGK